MPWYITSFIAHQAPEGEVRRSVYQTTEYWALIEADTSDAAFERARDVASLSVRRRTHERTGTWVLDDISDLLVLEGSPVAGAELIWAQEEMLPESVAASVREKRDLTAFTSSDDVSHRLPWYVCKIVLAEVHDSGSHGERVLVWTNTHIINADNAELAYSRSVNLGRQQAQESVTHRCNGETAHWEFEGLGDLIRAVGPPKDGGILWVEEFEASQEQLLERIPRRSALGVFEWEARLRAERSDLAAEEQS